ncbi:Uncharacterised protein [Mycobacteroides abscessus subsp. abscessus]|nr:Uncharacterised protein [Mycobacteroides abscessus subsp. abscessus]
MISPAQRRNIDIVRGTEDARGDIMEARVALLQQFENSAAVVI